ncbi:hypothetical protein [Bacteroides sp.]|uniref:fimbrial tip adhesin FimD n=1 Tax=Bacteroides sp. TaxID=29523 RepID=UPI0023C679BF|nr:hypothetical protein [Bacteroides sp.]MDE6217187.1 hypothetical protein [Bacteroides sp.]
MIIGCMAAFSFAACISENDALVIDGNEKGDGNSIILDISSAALPVSRAATEEAVGAEVKVSHIDVVIFNADDDQLEHHERVTSRIDGKTGTITISATRNSFEADKAYKVYLIANSTLAKDVYAGITGLNELRALEQEDREIHMTGLENVTNAPQTFLMDGMARLKGTAETDNPTVVLNSGNQTDDTVLQATLRRAAAKIVVRLMQGGDVQFTTTPTADGAVYYLRNMPYSTSVLSGIDGEAKLRATSPSQGAYFNWGTPDEITLTAYAYAHDWNDKSSLENEVRFIVNIPLTYQGVEVKSSYYQIPVSKEKRLNRNTYYYVTATVNAPGAEDPSEPKTLENIQYSVASWEEQTVNVGGETDRPRYLYVNEEEMEMHNITDDNTTLSFSSSSAVQARVVRAYFIDKLGQTQTISTNGITATPSAGLNGGIDIHSPIPTNNTIRYIELEVTNEDGVTPRKVTVKQYPLEYITNIQSWYSYRDDFKNNNSQPTTYEFQGDGIVGISYNSRNETYSKSQNSSGFWRSKVASSHNNDGSSTISYYRWQAGGGWTGWTNDGSNRSIQTAQSNGNARMYHIRITASSGDYTLGKPRLTQEGYTDSGADNAKLVSPSFMIASRLGFLNTSGNIDLSQSYAQNVVRDHCANYVEVYKDKNGNTVTLNDWRLPTEAELNIIMKFQGGEKDNADAIDYLLNANYYWSASGRILNSKSNSSGTSVRCIRDAYDDETVNQ